MNTLVAFHSESDNTRKLAMAVAAGAGTRALPLADVNPLKLGEYELICLGTPVHGGKPARALLEFIERMPRLPGTRCAAFCTMHAFGDHRTLEVLKLALEAKGLVFLGGYSALGWSRLVANFGPRIFNRGRPNRDELVRATAFGRGLVEKVQRAREEAVTHAA